MEGMNKVPPSKDKSDKQLDHDSRLMHAKDKNDGEKLKTTDTSEVKPRIVLTIRSEKPGNKSNMKIVSSEEKQSTKTQLNDSDNYDDEMTDASPKKSKSTQPVYESDEATSDNSNVPPKRSIRNRTKEYSDNVIANAIARKEKLYNEATPGTQQRLSRRIKPTAKVLANKELRIGLETQNNARLGITVTDKSPEEGVQTRRSARRRSLETHSDDRSSNEITPKKQKTQKKNIEVMESVEQKINTTQEQDNKKISRMKKKHLIGLGLQAIDVAESAQVKTSDVDTPDNANLALEDKQLDEDDTDGDEEMMLLKARYGSTGESEEEHTELDMEDAEDSYDEDFKYYGNVRKSNVENTPRRTRRRGHSESKSNNQSGEIQDDEKSTPRRRSTRLRRSNMDSSPYGSEQSEEEMETSEPQDGEEASKANCPDEKGEVIGVCQCENISNMYAAPADLEEPVFCRAIETVDGLRVGCSHKAMKEEDGSLAPLIRAGPRSPWILACKLHHLQLRKHMCCPFCGLFCSQGVFYQCSQNHLFHLDCGIAPNPKKAPGCPHCGVHSYQWIPFNRECWKVKIDMKCSNKRILLPEQRVQYTPAYLGFSKLHPSSLDQGPVIPEELLPPVSIDVKAVLEKQDEVKEKHPIQDLKDAILNFEKAEKLMSIILNTDINKDKGGMTCLHLAAGCGNLTAVYLLHYAGIDLDAFDPLQKTPLMHAVLALLEKPSKKSNEKDIKALEKESDKMSVDEKDGDKKEKDEVKEKGVKQLNEENLVKVIRYLVAAGCDVNLAGPEGMTALHMAAQHGGEEVAAIILSAASAEVDPRDHGGWTPLVWAAENNRPEVVRLLLNHGADASASDGEGNAVLHWCALAGSTGCLRLLLDRAPAHAVCAPNTHGDTPLHVAARQGHYASVVILLARGARTDIENCAGERAIEVASNECQAAISLNMQLAASVKDHMPQYKLLSSDISNGREDRAIPCINEVDDTPLPNDFVYVTQHVMPINLNVDYSLSTTQGCECEGGSCAESACACTTLSVRSWWAGGRLRRDFPASDPPMLFQCNQTCRCDLRKCSNAVVTNLLKRGATFVPVQVFRAGNARGWGLRAAAAIPRGSPVAAYCGELLAAAQADSRRADQYMFALDIKRDLLEQCEDKTQLCVDAASYGSAARFVNHSCRPNLSPVRVFTATRDLRLPSITLFAIRDIKAFEELTFDYGDKFWSVKSKWMRCECNTPECRYPTITPEES